MSKKISYATFILITLILFVREIYNNHYTIGNNNRPEKIYTIDLLKKAHLVKIATLLVPLTVKIAISSIQNACSM
jgi:hypothetical protein